METQNITSAQELEAIRIIELSLDKATKKGSFNLNEVHHILSALNILKTKTNSAK